MEPFFIGYMAAWGSACLAAIGMVGHRPRDFVITHSAYWRYLRQRWKLATFAVAGIGITLMAPYTGDPTWDHTDGALMSILTFATAPWAVGELYICVRKRRFGRSTFVALVAWLFSASWCYDLYLVIRDGMYPITWAANMAASSILYVLAGMLWNLEWRTGRGVTFGFMEPAWPDPASAAGFSKFAWFALPIMLLVAAGLAPFLWGGWG